MCVCGGGGSRPRANKKFRNLFWVCFFSPQFILQRGAKETKIFQGGGRFNFISTGKEVVFLLIPIKTYSTCDFQGGLDPPLDMSMLTLILILLL